MYFPQREENDKGQRKVIGDGGHDECTGPDWSGDPQLLPSTLHDDPENTGFGHISSSVQALWRNHLVRQKARLEEQQQHGCLGDCGIFFIFFESS